MADNTTVYYAITKKIRKSIKSSGKDFDLIEFKLMKFKIKRVIMHWDDPEGWDGEGGGRGVQDGEHM